MLTVEDGTGVSDADALVTLAEFRSWLTAYGGTAGTDADDEAAIRRASSWLSSYFRWNGSRTNGRDQGLALPRTDLKDCDGNSIPSNEIPIEVKRATFVAARFEQSTPFGLTPEVTPTGTAKREKVGPLEVEYRDPEYKGLSNIDNARPVLAQVEDYLRCMVSGRRPIPHPITV